MATKQVNARNDYLYETQKVLGKMYARFSSVSHNVSDKVNNAKSILEGKIQFLKNRLTLVKKMSLKYVAKQQAKKTAKSAKSAELDNSVSFDAGMSL